MQDVRCHACNAHVWHAMRVESACPVDRPRSEHERGAVRAISNRLRKRGKPPSVNHGRPSQNGEALGLIMVGEAVVELISDDPWDHVPCRKAGTLVEP